MRHALTGAALALRLDPVSVENVRLAVTEACTNVVCHAYDGEQGSLEVSVRATDAEFTVDVRDEGPGIRPTTSSRSLGIGLPLMAAMCDGLRITRDTEGANVVSMTFRRPPHLVHG